MFSYEVRFAYWQLLLYGIHIGHSFMNSSLYSGWFIFSYCQNLLIINLHKTILGLKNGFVGFDYSCKFGLPVWFINLDRSVEIYVNFSARKCGEFAYTTYWIHGMISNWFCIANFIRKLCHYTEDAHKGQFRKLDMTSSPWYRTRWSWPRSVFISSVDTTEFPSKECLTSRISCTGIVDTNISGHICNIATPGNDDSLDCIVFYNSSISQYILEKKYANIVGWYTYVKKVERIRNFSDWVFDNYVNAKGFFNSKKVGFLKEKRIQELNRNPKLDFYLFQKLDHTYAYSSGVKFFFGQSGGNSEFYYNVNIYKDDNTDDIDSNVVRDLVDIFLKFKFKICKIASFQTIKSAWRIGHFVRRKNLSKKLFKLHFLKNNYLPKVWRDDYFNTNVLVNRVWRNRIFKTFFKRPGFRNFMYASKFLKFFYLSNYSYKRGFIPSFGNNLLKTSYFALISLHAGFFLFKKKLSEPLLRRSNNFINLYQWKKVGFLVKWLSAKTYIKQKLGFILSNNKLSFITKFKWLYKVYTVLKKLLKRSVKMVYAYFNFYISFWYWNRYFYFYIKKSSYTYFHRIFKNLKNLSKRVHFLKFYKNSLVNLKYLQHILYKKDYDINKTNPLSNKLVRYFRILSLQLRRSVFSPTLNYSYYKIRRIKKHFLKRLKLNKSILKQHNNYNKAVKNPRMYNTPEGWKGFKRSIKRYKINKWIAKYNYLTKKKLGNISTFSKFLKKFKRKSRNVSRLFRYYNYKYNLNNFNFFQITKNFYNQELLDDVSLEPLSTYLDYQNFLVNEISDMSNNLPQLFFNKFSLSINIRLKEIDSYNIFHFIRKVWKSYLEKSLIQIKNYIKKYNFFISRLKKKKNLTNIIRLRRYKKNLRKIRYKYLKYFKFFRANCLIKPLIYSGFNRFLNVNHGQEDWAFKKNVFVMNEGYYIKKWHITWNKRILWKFKKPARVFFYERIKQSPYTTNIKFIKEHRINKKGKSFYAKIPEYYFTKEKKKKKRISIGKGNFTFLFYFYIRNYNTLFKYTNMIQKCSFYNELESSLGRTRNNKYIKNTKVMFWF